jgi:hypothetical protein
MIFFPLLAPLSGTSDINLRCTMRLQALPKPQNSGASLFLPLLNFAVTGL